MNKATFVRILAAAWMAAAPAAPGQMEIPDLIHYQGKLMDGTNLFTGLVPISFRLWDAPTGGVFPGCEDSNLVAVVDGLYSAYIGDDVVWGSLDNALNQTQVWIEVVIDGTNVVSPREQLVSAGFARYAAKLPANAVDLGMIAPDAVRTWHLADGQVTSNKIDWSTMPDETLRGYAENGAFTNAPEATGADAIALGTASRAQADQSVVGGGDRNTIGTGSVRSTIGGGGSNRIDNDSNGSTIAGGDDNIIGTNAPHNAIGGGSENAIGAGVLLSTIGGGELNEIIGDTDRSTIAGGEDNIISDATGGTIGGGRFNIVEHGASTVPGGEWNVAKGRGSFAAGQRAQALHSGTFVWNDDSSTNAFASTGTNQFLVRSRGGVGINTTNPAALIHAQPVGNQKAEFLLADNETEGGGAARMILAGDNDGTDAAHLAYDGTLEKFNAYISDFSGVHGPFLTIEKGGDVGIGRDNPSATLDVGGETILRGDATVTGVLYANGGGNFYADVGVAGDYVYLTSQTNYHFVAIHEFAEVWPNDDDPLYKPSGFGTFNNAYSTGPIYDIDLMAGVRLPHLARVQRLDAYYFDNTAPENLVLDVTLAATAYTNVGVSTTMSIVRTSSVSSASVQLFSTNFPVPWLVNNLIRRLDVSVRFTAGTNSPNLRFYGVGLEYVVDTVRP